MADVKISVLPASTVPLAGTEVLPIVQGGVTKQVSIANVTAGRAVSVLSVIGTTTNNNASAGSVGEYISSTVVAPPAGGTNLPNTTYSNVTSVSLTAGDWDVSGFTGWGNGSGTNNIALVMSQITTISADISNPCVEICNIGTSIYLIANTVSPLATTRISIASTTTVYLTSVAYFSGGGTISGYGTLRARRVR